MNLSSEERQTLGRIARAAVRAAVEGGECRLEKTDSSNLMRAGGGCFVTLKTGERLRGCLGCFISGKPLCQTVAEYARLSVLEDPRFVSNRIRAHELPGLRIEISVLSPLEPCPDPLRIRLGVDGIHIRKGFRSGVFLPQVAIETGWNAEEFWGHCSRDKAGLSWDAWRGNDVELMTFTADVIECEEDG